MDRSLQQVGFSPEFRSSEALASFGITSLEEVPEEVATVRILSKLGSLRQLGLAVAHEALTPSGQSREHVLVESEVVDGGISTTLFSWLIHVFFVISRC